MELRTVVDVFREGKLELLVLTKTKLKGNGAVSWCGVNGIIAGVQEMERGRKGVAILLNDVWHSVVVDFGCVSSRILWIKFNFLRVKVCEERDRFGNDMGRSLDTVGNVYRLYILGDLNGWIGDRTIPGLIGAFGVPGENDSGRRVMEICSERGMCAGNTYFQHKGLLKCTRVIRDQDGAEIKSMTDLALMKRDMLQYVQDVRVVKGIRQGLSDPYVVICKVRLVEAWVKRREVVVWTRRIRNEKLREHQYREGYARFLEGKGVDWYGDNNAENMWEQVKRTMVESATEVCGSVGRGGGERTQRVLEW